MTEVAERQQAAPQQPRSLLTRVADRFGVEPNKMLDTLKATAFKSQTPATNEQMMALLIVAEQYHLNPWTKEIFAFPDKGSIVPVVSIDGWVRIVNEHAQFDGVEFHFDDAGSECRVTMYRKDRSHPIVVTEYMTECKRDTQPWRSHPRRMLRHKAFIQCARVAFGFAGIYDEDEAQRIVNMGPADVVQPGSSIEKVRSVLHQPKRETVDGETGEIVEQQQDEPAAGELIPPPTYAQLADAINKAAKAGNADDAAAALDAGKHLPKEFFDELTALYTRAFSKE